MSAATRAPDLLAAHRQEFAIGDDDSPLDHHVAHGARRERVDHVLRQRLKRPKRRIAEVEPTRSARLAGGDGPTGSPSTSPPRRVPIAKHFSAVNRLAVQARHLLQQRAGAHLVEHRDAAVGAAAVGAESDADAEGAQVDDVGHAVAEEHVGFGL